MHMPARAPTARETVFKESTDIERVLVSEVERLKTRIGVAADSVLTGSVRTPFDWIIGLSAFQVSRSPALVAIQTGRGKSFVAEGAQPEMPFAQARPQVRSAAQVEMYPPKDRQHGPSRFGTSATHATPP
jgi:hypothetical protein